MKLSKPQIHIHFSFWADSAALLFTSGTIFAFKGFLGGPLWLESTDGTFWLLSLWEHVQKPMPLICSARNIFFFIHSGLSLNNKTSNIAASSVSTTSSTSSIPRSWTSGLTSHSFLSSGGSTSTIDFSSVTFFVVKTDSSSLETSISTLSSWASSKALFSSPFLRSSSSTSSYTFDRK